MNTPSRAQNKPAARAQAMVEFAIVAPVLFMMLFGVFEVGRMLYIYSAVNNASREAARYGSALGFDDYGFHKYRNCSGIKYTAWRSTYFIPQDTLAVDIRYDKGPNDPIYSDGHGPDTDAEWALLTQCDLYPAAGVPLTPGAGEDANVYVDSGYRVLVRVGADYSPLTKLMPFPDRTFTSQSARTILGFVDLESGGGGGGGGGGGTSTATTAASATFTNTPLTETPTETATATPTATYSGPFASLTPVNTSTPTNTALPQTLTPTSTLQISPTPTATKTLVVTPSTQVPTATLVKTATPAPVTATFTATNTATSTATKTSTATSTGTSTPVLGCSSITTSDISMATNSQTISMTITNPHDALTVSSIVVKWNAASGASGNKTLTLQGANFGSTSWTISNSSGNYTITPTSTLTLPGNNATTIVTFTFDKNYQNPITNGTTITINLSTAGCGPITKTK